MNKPKIFVFALLFICFSSFSNAFAQEKENAPRSEASYGVILNILVASPDAAKKTEIPANLLETVSKFRKNFSYSGYRLVSTNFQRIADTGNIRHKSSLNELGDETGLMVFSDWSLNGLRSGAALGNKNHIDFQSFNFNARIPYKVFKNVNEENKEIPVYNYESIGISLQRFSVPENAPTLIGTLAMPKSDELIFFVLTVKPVS